jgi:hypothetical protein
MQKEIRELQQALQDNPDIDSRAFYQAIDVLQEYTEYIDSLIDDLPPVDFSVTVKMDRTGVRFKTLDDFASFLAERMNR